VYIIEKSLKLSENVYEIWVNAPHVTRNAKAGQFVIIRTDETGERIPLTISKISGDLVRIIFMAVGKTTHALAAVPAGGAISDIAGPLGCPSEIKKYGTCVLVGGGVGIASTPVIAQALKDAGNRVIGILGARNADFLILEDEMAEICDKLLIATDDGSKGHHGFAADLLKQVIDDENVDVPEVKRVVFCSGKIYYDLLARKNAYNARDIALVRIEQLYPFPEKQLETIVEKYNKALVYLWVQEEPENMGAWTYINYHFRKIPLIHITRLPSGSPATGLHEIHQAEQEEILYKVFRTCDCERKNKYCGLQCMVGKSRQEILRQFNYIFFDKRFNL